MDRYIVLISDVNNSFHNLQNISFDKKKTHFFSCFSHLLQQRAGNNFIFYLHLTEDSTRGSDYVLNNLNWTNVNDNFENHMNVTPLQSSEIIFHLADKLSYPGSYLLDVYWCIFDNKLTDIKSFTPLLGAIKKLKLWQFAEINLLIPSAACSPALLLMSKFISAKLVEFSDPNTITSIIWKNRSILWRGSIELKLSQLAPITFDDFLIVQHSCHDGHVKLSTTSNSESCTSNLWFGSTIKVIELIDLATLPLFWFSGSIFSLQCAKSNDAGLRFKKVLEGSKTSSLLCRLSFIHTMKEFPPCSELSAKHWKNTVRQNPLDLHPPNISLCEKPKDLFLAITIPTNCQCMSLQTSDMLCLHAHVLHLPDDIDTSFIIDQEIRFDYEKTSTSDESSLIHPPCSSIDVSHFLNFDDNWGRYFSKILESWKLRKSDKITTEELQTLILESWKTFKKKFQSVAHEFSQEGTLLSMLPKRHTSYARQCVVPEVQVLKLRSRECSRKVESNAENVPCASTGRLKTNSINLSASDILKFFDGPKYQTAIKSLLDTHPELTPTPSFESLSNFSSAIVTSYHGINYNIDAQGSEKMDQYYRKLAKKLIRFETLSLGSTTQVLSRMTSNFDDSPLKPKRPVHTPRKKKKIRKVVEKLYRKRTTIMSNSASANSLKTPTKKNSVSNKDELLASPSVHKMSLRSSTPSKRSNRVKLTPNSKAAAKKKIQKQYVNDNKKHLRDVVLRELQSHGITKGHSNFDQCVKKLYRVSMAFLKDLKTSKDLANKMKVIVKENARLVLSLE